MCSDRDTFSQTEHATDKSQREAEAEGCELRVTQLNAQRSSGCGSGRGWHDWRGAAGCCTAQRRTAVGAAGDSPQEDRARLPGLTLVPCGLLFSALLC